MRAVGGLDGAGPGADRRGCYCRGEAGAEALVEVVIGEGADVGAEGEAVAETGGGGVAPPELGEDARRVFGGAGALQVDVGEAGAGGDRFGGGASGDFGVGGDVVGIQTFGGQAHHLDEVAADDEVAAGEAQATGFVFERGFVGGVFAD